MDKPTIEEMVAAVEHEANDRDATARMLPGTADHMLPQARALRAAAETLRATAQGGWSYDMNAAPRDRHILVSTNTAAGLPAVTFATIWHPDADFCGCEFRDAVAWQELPTPAPLPQEGG